MYLIYCSCAIVPILYLQKYPGKYYLVKKIINQGRYFTIRIKGVYKSFVIETVKIYLQNISILRKNPLALAQKSPTISCSRN